MIEHMCLLVWSPVAPSTSYSTVGFQIQPDVSTKIPAPYPVIRPSITDYSNSQKKIIPFPHSKPSNIFLLNRTPYSIHSIILDLITTVHYITSPAKTTSYKLASSYSAKYQDFNLRKFCISDFPCLKCIFLFAQLGPFCHREHYY